MSKGLSMCIYNTISTPSSLMLWVVFFFNCLASDLSLCISQLKLMFFHEEFKDESSFEVKLA